MKSEKIPQRRNGIESKTLEMKIHFLQQYFSLLQFIPGVIKSVYMHNKSKLILMILSVN